MMSSLPYTGFHTVRQQKFYEINSNQDYQIYIYIYFLDNQIFPMLRTLAFHKRAKTSLKRLGIQRYKNKLEQSVICSLWLVAHFTY